VSVDIVTMGYNVCIRLVDQYDDNGEQKYIMFVDYISYNVSKYSTICKIHKDQFGNCKKECQHKHLWHVTDDVDKHFGYEVADRAYCAIRKLARYGIYLQKDTEPKTGYEGMIKLLRKYVEWGLEHYYDEFECS
jgi:hypothetical protein